MGSDILDSNSHVMDLGKSKIMLLGPTGSGKTLLTQKVAEFLDIPFAVCDCTTLTAAGYEGANVGDVFAALLRNASYSVDRAQIGIIFLDEVDKIGCVPEIQQRDVRGKGVQEAMLMMLESSLVKVPGNNSPDQGKTVHLDTTNILFVAAGAYVGLETIIRIRKNKEYVGFGVPASESSGRRGTSIADQAHQSAATSAEEHIAEKDAYLQQVEAEDLVKFGMMSVHLTFSPESLYAIARLAMERRTGVRGLRAILESVLLNPMFEVPGSDVKSVHITQEVVRGTSSPVYSPARPE